MGLQMAQAKVWSPVESDCNWTPFSTERKLQRWTTSNLVRKAFHDCGPTPMSDFVVVPLTAVLHHCVHAHALTTFVRRSLASWNETGHCTSLSSNSGCTCATAGKGKLAGLVLRGQGRARALEDVQKVLEGLLLGSKFHRRGVLQSTVGCSSSCRTVLFCRSHTQTIGKTRGHSCCSLKHASGPRSCGSFSSGSCGSQMH